MLRDLVEKDDVLEHNFEGWADCRCEKHQRQREQCKHRFVSLGKGMDLC